MYTYKVIYNSLSQIKICSIILKTGLNNGQKFLIEVFFHDGQRLVCRVVVEPIVRERDGKWCTVSSLSLYEEAVFSSTLRDPVRECAVTAADEIIDTFFGDE